MAFPPLPKRLVGVNTKMYFDFPATTSYVSAVTKIAPPPDSSLGVFVIPSYPCIAAASKEVQAAPQILLGAQDCHAEDSGAYTGEVSPLMLKQLGCSMVILGHADRRAAPFHENDDLVGGKARAVARNGMIPLVCIGERNKSNVMSEGVGIAIRECSSQITSVLLSVPPEAPIIFAYEPVWAIGAQEPAPADHILNVTKGLKEIIKSEGRRREFRILYGGSAKPGTWATLKDGLDGLFLGRFAHDIGNFKRVIQEVQAS